jgi:hypothetical protein
MASAKIHAIGDATRDDNPSFDELRSVGVAKTPQRVANRVDFTALLFAPKNFPLGNASSMRVHVGDLEI